MQEFDELRSGATPESAWRSAEEEGEPDIQITKTTDELCAMVRSEEKLNVVTYWILFAVVSGFAVCFLYNVFSVAQPWIRLGSAWTLGVICYLFGVHLQRGPRRSETNEPCAHFLEREFKGKR